jgi:hypothetical protein
VQHLRRERFVCVPHVAWSFDDCHAARLSDVAAVRHHGNDYPNFNATALLAGAGEAGVGGKSDHAWAGEISVTKVDRRVVDPETAAPNPNHHGHRRPSEATARRTTSDKEQVRFSMAEISSA